MPTKQKAHTTVIRNGIEAVGNDMYIDTYIKSRTVRRGKHDVAVQTQYAMIWVPSVLTLEQESTLQSLINRYRADGYYVQVMRSGHESVTNNMSVLIKSQSQVCELGS